MIGNRDAMGIAAEIVKRMLGVAKRTLGINHPIGTKQAPEHRREGLRRLKRSQSLVKAEFTAGVQFAQAGHKCDGDGKKTGRTTVARAAGSIETS